MEAPLCQVCGVREWRHLCSGVAASEIERRATRGVVVVKRLPKVTKAALVVTKVKPAGRGKGRAPLGGVAMSAAERMRRYRARKAKRTKGG